MTALKNPRKVRKLLGYVIILNQFVSNAIDKFIPFYNSLKGRKKFDWTEDCQKAFEQLKVSLEQVPLLSIPQKGKVL